MSGQLATRAVTSVAKKTLSKADLRQLLAERRAEMRKDPLKHVSALIHGEIRDYAIEHEPPPRVAEHEAQAAEDALSGLDPTDRALLSGFMGSNGVTPEQLRKMTPGEAARWRKAYDAQAAKVSLRSHRKLAEREAEAAGRPKDPTSTIAHMLMGLSQTDNREFD